jgi:hypothetical protein
MIGSGLRNVLLLLPNKLCIDISSVTISTAPLLIIHSFSVLTQPFSRKAEATALQKNPFHYIAGIHLPFACAGKYLCLTFAKYLQ